MLKERTSPEMSPPPSGGFDPKYGDRILGWCLLASILINLGFGVWLSFADLYGTQRQAAQNKQMKVQVYRPPVKQKPKPKPKVIPPKPKVPPKIVHLKVPPPKPIPHFTPHPPPPAPRAPAVGHTVKNNSPTAIPIGPVTQAPPVAAPQTPGTDTRPQAPVAAPPAPPPPVVTPPAPPPPVHHDPPPPPPPPKPKGYVDVESREASIDDNSIDSPDASNIDPPPSKSCVISYEIDETGHVTGARIKRQSGSSEFDQRCLDAIKRGRGKPGVQDHIVYRQRVEYTFSI